jgi:hypothetical protein
MSRLQKVNEGHTIGLKQKNITWIKKCGKGRNE